MRCLAAFFLLVSLAFGQSVNPELPRKDAVRIREFYRLTPQIADKVWPGWSTTPAPLLLVTNDAEFLTHYPDPPADFKKFGEGFYVRPRHYPANFLATFPAFAQRSRSSSLAKPKTPTPRPARRGSSPSCMSIFINCRMVSPAFSKP